ncbi:T9SS type A sorting domain-containing protein [Chryseobacterium sp. Marseille-Q3244]|uniref:T9SS type A sorting domain-containing protein n=1 Tax=Chryseobacterium sp. Marseille-Q3244 TaxID=2758092 RepID=UPI00202417AB|nr:T9SS type A sorting domain-containing protein [Chryseobacterium sp. Marseille-Q3244]
MTEAYALPTSVLAAKEIQAGSKLSALPVPTNKILNVMNPGKLVTNKSFSASEGKISVDVENLPKGVYVSQQ